MIYLQSEQFYYFMKTKQNRIIFLMTRKALRKNIKYYHFIHNLSIAPTHKQNSVTLEDWTIIRFKIRFHF